MSARDIFQFRVDGFEVIRIKELWRDESKLRKKKEEKVIGEGQKKRREEGHPSTAGETCLSI